VALSALLGLEDDIEVVGCCADGLSAWTEAQRLRPDVIVARHRDAGPSPVSSSPCEFVSMRLPSRLVIVTTFARAGYLRRALDAGVSGYLLKRRSPPTSLPTLYGKSIAGGGWSIRS